ncbi:MAG: hypothetical protein FJZ63_00580 [Chlamydiae bacterium]|nr:hypothetical protein [Chlamydiota bacterium]
MVYKPMDESVYKRYIKAVGWSLEKGSIDWKLTNENGQFVCTIKISHGKKSDKGVVAHSVKKTEQEFKKRGWSWPPKKK